MNDDLALDGNPLDGNIHDRAQADMALLSMAFFFVSLGIILLS